MLGHLETRIEREDASSSFGCPAMGESGRSVCCQSALLAAVGWPLSPFLSLYVCVQRSRLRRHYVEEEETAATTPCTLLIDLCDALLLRPCTLWQHLQFVQRKETEGMLRYGSWEGEALRDYKQVPKPPVETHLVFLVGPRQCGKTTLFRKLLIILPGDAEHERLKDAGKVQIGVRCVEVGQDRMRFVEVRAPT
jgi:hypothetical protein